MATNTTYQGKPKPMGGQGHYFESRRHALQARGIHTGHKADELAPTPEPLIDLGILNTEGKEMVVKAPEPEVPRTEEGLEDVEEEAIEEKESKPKKPTFGEKLKEFGGKVQAGYEREKAILARKRQAKLAEDTGKELSVDEEDQAEMESELDSEGFTGGSRYGQMLADLMDNYNSEDMAEVTEDELEDLAVKFETRTKESFLKPYNPFLEELKSRIKAKEEIKMAKAKIDAELEPSREQIRKEIAEIKNRAVTPDNRDWLEKIIGW